MSANNLPEAHRGKIWTVGGVLVFGVVAAVLAVGEAEKSKNEVTPETKTQRKTEGPEFKASELPAPFRKRTDEPSTKGLVLSARVAKVDANLTAIVNLVDKARKSGNLPDRMQQPDDLVQIPRSFDAYLPAFDGKPAPAIGQFEWVSLISGIAKKRGLPLKIGYDQAERHSKMTLEERRYVVGTPGAWFAFDRKPVNSKDVALLDRRAILANTLAWRALGAIEYDDAFATEAMGYARRLAPDDLCIAYLAGRIQIVTGLEDIGFSALETLAAKDGDAMAHFTLGELALDAKRLFKAQQALSKAASLDPAFGEPLVLLAEVSLARHDVTPDDQKAALLKEVAATIARAEKADPKVYGLRTVKSKLAEIEGRGEQTATLLKEEFDLHSNRTGAAINLANYYLSKEKPDEAKAVYDKALAQNNRDPVIRVQLANILLQANDVEGAIAQLNQAIKMHPEHPELRLLLAQIYVQQDDITKGRAALEAQVKRVPKDPRAPLLLAQLDLAERDYKQAIERVAPILAKEKDHPEATFTQYFATVLSGGDVKAARKNAIRVLGGHIQVADLMMQRGIMHEAAAILDEAMVAIPSDDRPYLLRVAIYAAAGQEEQAKALAQKRLKAVGEEKAKELKVQFDEAIEGGRKMRAAAEEQKLLPGQGTEEPQTP